MKEATQILECPLTVQERCVEGGEKGLDCITSEGGHERALYT